MANILDIFFPKRCVNCRKLGSYICLDCQKTLKLRSALCPECDKPAIDGITHPKCLKSWGLYGLTTVFFNSGVIKKAVKALKYRYVSDLAKTLVGLIPQTILKHSLVESGWVIYPIPLHKDRLRWRGFNQAEVLAKFLSKKFNFGLIDGLLIRQVKRIPQADIVKKDDRIKNAQGLFIVTSKLKASKLPSILLFDDVWTTGATMKQACKVLKRSGIKKVWGMTLAR